MSLVLPEEQTFSPDSVYITNGDRPPICLGSFCSYNITIKNKSVCSDDNLSTISFEMNAIKLTGFDQNCT